MVVFFSISLVITPAHGLDAERERGDVEQQHVLALAGQHAALDGRADGHRLVRVDVLARLLAEQGLDRVAHLRHAGLAADQDDLVNLAGGQAGVLERDLAGFDGALDQLVHQRFELGAGDLDVHVLRPAGVGSDVRQVHVGLLGGGQFDLGLLGAFLQALHGERVVAQVDALLFLELVDQEVDQAVVEVLAAEEGVAVGGQHFELLLAVDVGDLDDGHVEGAAAEVVHGDLHVLGLCLVQAVGQRGRGRLVDDALDVQACDAAGILGGLALAVVEVGRYGDDRFGDFFAQIRLNVFLDLHQHAGGNLRCGHLLAVDIHPGVAVVGLDDLVGHQLDVFLHGVFGEAAADQTLDGVQGVLRVGDRLALGRLADDDFAVLGERDHGRGGACAFAVLDDLGLAAFHDGDAGIGGTEVDADDLGHEECSLKDVCLDM